MRYLLRRPEVDDNATKQGHGVSWRRKEGRE
jgi:hypothetical protein